MKNFFSENNSFTILLYALVFILCQGAVSPLKNYKRVIRVDPRYSFELDVNFDAKTLTVNVEAKTTGFVGFGFSPKGLMDGADIFVGGVKHKKPYFSDYHGQSWDLIEDKVKNWELVEAKENVTYTVIKFSRLFNTGDNVDDLQIKDKTTFIIWSFGSTDTIEYHGVNRGSRQINIFDSSNFSRGLSHNKLLTGLVLCCCISIFLKRN